MCLTCEDIRTFGATLCGSENADVGEFQPPSGMGRYVYRSQRDPAVRGRIGSVLVSRALPAGVRCLDWLACRR